MHKLRARSIACVPSDAASSAVSSTKSAHDRPWCVPSSSRISQGEQVLHHDGNACGFIAGRHDGRCPCPCPCKQRGRCAQLLIHVGGSCLRGTEVEPLRRFKSSRNHHGLLENAIKRDKSPMKAKSKPMPPSLGWLWLGLDSIWNMIGT